MRIVKHCQTYPISLFVTGDSVEEYCRAFCDSHGLCVTVTKTNYIFTGGNEEGYIIGLINYPRFPKRPMDLRLIAVQLAEYLFSNCYPAGSYTMQTPDETVFVSNREQDQE